MIIDCTAQSIPVFSNPKDAFLSALWQYFSCQWTENHHPGTCDILICKGIISSRSLIQTYHPYTDKPKWHGEERWYPSELSTREMPAGCSWWYCLRRVSWASVTHIMPHASLLLRGHGACAEQCRHHTYWLRASLVDLVEKLSSHFWRLMKFVTGNFFISTWWVSTQKSNFIWKIEFQES